ncbi:MAG: hypothetical protein WBN03_10200, partial [Desulfobacterales bacterium]
VDAAGNVYVTGESIGSSSNADYATIKYDPGGNELWVARYNGPGNSNDQAAALVVDAAGNVYVTGKNAGEKSDHSGYYTDYATIKYDPDGNELWVARYSGPGNSNAKAAALAVDAAGNVYVTGGSGGDYVTIKLTQIGSDGGEGDGGRGGGEGGRGCFITAITN